MKFAQKLSLSMILLLAASFSAGGYFMVHQNFKDALNTALGQNEARHALECYAMQTELFAVTANGETLDDEALQAGFLALPQQTVDDHTCTLYDDANTVLATSEETPPGERLPNAQTYRLIQQNGKKRMVLATELTSPTRALWLQSSYDVSPLFEARTRQMRRLWEMELITLLLCGGLIVWLSARLTRPIQQLCKASTRVAQGDYTVRTHLETGDEIEQVSQSFDAMAQAVEEKVQALHLSVRQRDDFMGAFTHELKTPMTAILGYADILRTTQCDPQTQQRAANYIFREANRVELLSQKLLRLFRLTEEKIVLQPISLAKIFACAADASAFFCKGIAVQWQPVPNLTVMADAELLCDLLYNLLHNAVKAKPKNGVLCTAEQLPDGKVRITVADTGCGVPAEEISRIQEPFYMVDKSRARADGGSGMGLALCEKIAQAHGTSLQIESKIGEGTTVSFVLPVAREKTAEVKT